MLKKICTSLILLCYSCFSIANPYNAPDIGTAGVLGLSIQKEKQIGEVFIKKARASLPIVYDPVLNEYLNSVGNKLILHAQNVNFPFEFFIINDKTLNAAAFLGGKVQVNTGLFFYADTEDEFASVLAHEISHVTQRHIARFIESQAQGSNLTYAGIIGAIALSLLNPAVGLAAVTTTVGLSAQSQINFTRDNEYEADRLGINLLYQAGFNPKGTTDLFSKLLSMQGNFNPAFALLLTHPLSQERIAEATYRLLNYPKRSDSTNPNFYLAKARVITRYIYQDDIGNFKQVLLNDKKLNAIYKNYALALCAYEQGDLILANSYLNQLSNLDSSLTNNIFLLDLKTDILLKQNNLTKAKQMLNSALNKSPNNETLVINLANVYTQEQNYKSATKLLNRFIIKNKDSVLAYDMLSTAYFKDKNQCDGYVAKGELLALKGSYNTSIASFNQALSYCFNELDKERIKARVVEIANQKALEESLQL